MYLPAVFVAAICLALIDPASAAADAKPSKPAPRAAKPAHKPPVAQLPEATPEQLEAAQRVYYGYYECELRQAIDITADTPRRGYVQVRHGKATYVMKPVLSHTGAIRLEDVKGQTLMVQIATKSMLMDVKVGRRLVDECVSPAQREAIDAARAQAAEAAASAARAASAPSISGAASAASAPAIAEPASAPASGPAR